MATVEPKVTYPINAQQWAASNSTVAPTPPYSGTFIPVLWSGKLARKFYGATVFGAISNRDWEGEIKEMGDTVVINTVPDITIKPYKAGMQLEYEVPAGETFELRVDQGDYFAFMVNDVMKLQCQPDLMDMFSGDAAEKMKDAIDKRGLYKIFFDDQGLWKARRNPVPASNVFDAAWELNMGANAGCKSQAYNLGTDAAPVALTGDNILSYITMMSTVMDEADIPQTDRYLVIGPYERQLLMMSPLAQAQFMGDSTSILRNGRIGSIDRFTIYLSNSLPRANAGFAWDGKTAGQGQRRHLCFAGHKSAVSFASQINKVEHLRNPTDFGDLVRGLNIWGMQVTAGQSLVPLVVAN